MELKEQKLPNMAKELQFKLNGIVHSSDEKQIREIFTAEIEANVKKGWEEVKQ